MESEITTKKIVGIVVGVLVVVLVLTWIGQGNDFFMYKFFAPRQVEVQHEVFKNSQAYVDGMVQNLQQYMLEYQKAEKEHKDALKTVIIRESGKIDEKYLPSDLRAFIHKLKSEI